MRIGFIGTGHIAAPMVRHLAAKGHDIMVTRRGEQVSSALAAELGVAVGEPQEVVDGTDIVVLCLRPDVAPEVVAALEFRAGQRVVSVMAGITTEALARLCAPVSDFVVTVPLGFVEVGGCPLAAYGDSALLAELFAPENPVVPVAEEAALNAHFAVAAMLPGLLDLLASSADWLASQTGDRDASAFFVTQMVAGFLAAMDKTEAGELEALRDAQASPNTLSLQVLTALRNAGAPEALHDALAAIGKKLRTT